MLAKKTSESLISLFEDALNSALNDIERRDYSLRSFETFFKARRKKKLSTRNSSLIKAPVAFLYLMRV